MERKIGEVFSIKLKVVKADGKGCSGCFFRAHTNGCNGSIDTQGHCMAERRTDEENVIFVEVKEESD